MTKVFLSYARGDDVAPFDPTTSFVARLYRDLNARGFEVWFDRVSMPSRRLTFHQEIRDAVAACDRLVLVVGPWAAASDYVRQEWQFGWFEAEKVVTPILRHGDYPLVIPELSLLHCEDFRSDADYALHLEQLVRILNDPEPPLGKLIGVPGLPAHYLSRTDRLIPLRDAIRSGLDSPTPFGGAAARQQFHDIAGSAKQVGMHGMGGIGKSILANLLARDRQIREAFPDGIVWIGLGSVPVLVELMRRVHRNFGGDGALATEHEGKTKLKELFADKAVLLVLDDAWRRSDVDAFDVLGPRCRAMITTRDAGLLTSLGGTHHMVELLTDDEALRLLALAVGCDLEQLPSEARQVLKQCGRLPLAVSLAGGMVAAGSPWKSLLVAFDRHKLEFFEDEHRAEPHQNLLKTIEVSVQALAAPAQSRLIELAVFPENEASPATAVGVLWQHTGGLDDLDSQQLLIKLKQRSLVQLTASDEFGGSIVGRLSLHDLIHDYCIRRVTLDFGNAAVLHERLLAAYQQRCPNGWWTGPNDGYFLDHLRIHLAGAGRADELSALLTSLNWLEAKTLQGLVFDLLEDYSFAEETDLARSEASDRLCEISEFKVFLENNLHLFNMELGLVYQQAINEPRESAPARMAREALARGQLNTSLWCRLNPSVGDSHHIRLVGHTGAIRGCGFTLDGTLAVSVANRDPVRVWDATTGKLVRAVDIWQTWSSGAFTALAFAGASFAVLELHGLHIVSTADWTVHSIDFGPRARAKAIVASLGEFFVAIGNEIHVFNESGLPVATITDPDRQRDVESLAVCADGSAVYSIERHGLLIEHRLNESQWDTRQKLALQWDAASQKLYLCLLELWEQEKRAEDWWEVSLSDNGGYLLIRGSFRFDLFDLGQNVNVANHKNATHAMSCASLSPDGDLVGFAADWAAGCKPVGLYRHSSSQTRYALLPHGKGCSDIRISNGSTRIVVGSDDQTLSLFGVEDAADVDIERLKELANDHILGATVSCNNSCVACWSIDHRVSLWDIGSGALLFATGSLGERGNDRISRVGVSVDGSLLFVTQGDDDDARLRIWRTKDGSVVFDTARCADMSLKGQLSERFYATFTQHYDHLIVIGGTQVCVVALSNGDQVRRGRAPKRLRYGDTRSLLWDENGRLLLIEKNRQGQLSDHACHLWDPLAGSFIPFSETTGKIFDTNGTEPHIQSGDMEVILPCSSEGHDPHERRCETDRPCQIVQLSKAGRPAGCFTTAAPITFCGLVPNSDFIVVGQATGEFSIMRRATMP